MRIAALTELDADRVFEIYVSAQAAASVPIGPRWSREQIQDEVNTGLAWWAVSNERHAISAFLLYRDLPDAFEITMLATSPEGRRKGAMSELIEALQVEAKTRSKAIWLEVHESNLPARKLYDKTGFREVGRRPRYYVDAGAAILYSWG